MKKRNLERLLEIVMTQLQMAEMYGEDMADEVERRDEVIAGLEAKMGVAESLTEYTSEGQRVTDLEATNTRLRDRLRIAQNEADHFRGIVEEMYDGKPPTH